MNGKRLTVNHTEAYQNYLRAEERSRGTQEKYRRDIDEFVRWLGGRLVTKEVVVEWKRYLVEQNYAGCFERPAGTWTGASMTSCSRRPKARAESGWLW